MAGGPILPFSAYPVTASLTFATFLTAVMPQGLGYAASLSGDSTWRLFYWTPQVLPSGTATLLLTGQANATTGVAKLNPKWHSYAANEVPATADLTAEGVQTMTFATTAYRLTQISVTLDADTVVAGELIMMDLVGETSGWTLAANLSILPQIIWV